MNLKHHHCTPASNFGNNEEFYQHIYVQSTICYMGRQEENDQIFLTILYIYVVFFKKHDKILAETGNL